MAFVNEYVAEEDIDKFDLYGIYKKYKPYSMFKKEELEYDWVIDREKDIWFKYIALMDDPNHEHQYTQENIFILHIHNTNIEVRIWKAKREGNAVDGPILIELDLISITPKSLDNVNAEEIKKLVKEALEVYGFRGVSKQVPNTTVKCNF